MVNDVPTYWYSDWKQALTSGVGNRASSLVDSTLVSDTTDELQEKLAYTRKADGYYL